MCLYVKQFFFTLFLRTMFGGFNTLLTDESNCKSEAKQTFVLVFGHGVCVYRGLLV